MKLDRNINRNGRGKYALIKLREAIPEIVPGERPRRYSVPVGAVDFGDSVDSDFFVIRLKDKYAEMALSAYAEAARKDDVEYAAEIDALADIARCHPGRRIPD